MIMPPQLKSREPEWSNPQIEDGKLPEMLKNCTHHKLMGIYRCEFSNQQQLLKHITRVFTNWHVRMYFLWVRVATLDLSPLINACPSYHHGGSP